MKTYDATVTREGKWWMISIAALDGLTQARRLAEVEQAAREYIAVTLDIPISQAAVHVIDVSVPDRVDVTRAIAEIQSAREDAAKAEQRASEATRWLVSELYAAAVPMRDIGEAVGLSHQRVAQLIGTGR